MAWSTRDGLHWTSRIFGAANSGAQAVSRVGDAGYLAVAESIWGSPDGLRWRPLAGWALTSRQSEPAFTLSSVACGADRCLAVGADHLDSPSLALWIGPRRVGP